MARNHGRCWRGAHRRIGARLGQRGTTPVAGPRLGGTVAPMVLDDAIQGDRIEARLRHVLATLRPGDVVIMDALSSHGRVAARDPIEAAGAEHRVLAPRSPGFNRFEIACAKPGAMPRRVAERPRDALRDAIGRVVDLITPAESAIVLTAAGHEPV